ncbi:MAG: DUF1552 domain-containing protein [Bradymonadia bacterium]
MSRQKDPSHMNPSHMNPSHMNRRQLLRGLGGFALTTPFMPSLLPKSAQAQNMERGAKRFVSFVTPHGGIWGVNMYPGAQLLDQQMEYAGHTIRAGALRANAQGGQSVISPVLSASAEALDEAMVRQLNVIRGLDVPYYLAHHRGGHLGNFAANDGNGSEGAFLWNHPRPTIDQVMAWSPSFYGDLSTNRLRTIVVGQRGISWNWSRPSDRSGRLQPLSPEQNNIALFNRLFRPNEDPSTPRPLVVDRVRESYRSLMESNRRLGAADRRRLSEHMDRLFELERRITAQVACEVVEPGRSGELITDGDAAGQVRFWQNHNDVVATALACGVSRLAVMGAYATFSDFVGDWHQDVAHQCLTQERQPLLVEAQQRFFEHVFLDLARKLSAIEDPAGGNVLDHTLIAWTQESGMNTHDSMGIPIVTAGGAGGAMPTGQYIDYRNQGVGWPIAEGENPGGLDEPNRPGLYYNQWLSTVLDSMGVPRAEYAEYSRDLNGDYDGAVPEGYGVVFASEFARAQYAQAWGRLGERLPYLG